MIKRTETIGEIVANFPKVIPYFKELEIDYCCGGFRKLDDVLKEQGLNKEIVWGKLEEIKEIKLDNKEDFKDMTKKQLSDYIVEIHHQYLRNNLPQIYDWILTLLRVHGKNHEELFKVSKLFGELKIDLEQHILKEELIIFPKLIEGNYNKDLLKEINEEHENAGDILKSLRKTTNKYTLPDDACETYERTYQSLKKIEEDIHQHIHLENNILFK